MQKGLGLGEGECAPHTKRVRLGQDLRVGVGGRAAADGGEMRDLGGFTQLYLKVIIHMFSISFSVVVDAFLQSV